MRNLLHIILVVILIIPACRKQEEKKKEPPSADLQWAKYHDYYKNDSAFYYYKRVIDNSHDSIEKAEAYFYMGRRLLDVGDYYSAQESFLSSIKTLNEKDTTHYSYISADYNSLANATLALDEYEPAIQYYYHASDFATDRDAHLHVLNNVGVAYQKKGDYKKAIAAFDSAIVQTTTDTSLKARIISNFARTKWLADSNYNALPEFMTALELRRLVGNSLGMSTSFDHLSNYYAKSRPDSALFYALKRFEIVQELQNPTDKIEVLRQLMSLSPAIEAKKYTDQYVKLDDSLSSARIKDRRQYLLIRSDIEKSKADNVLLKKHIGNQRQIIWITVLSAILLILALILRARIRRKRLKQESEIAIRESKLKTSQKVHDVVANGLYKIMNELEHRETIDKEPLLNKIEG
ncbi:MAG TPA: tetratricopeptide repeat protein, partial [Chitinophagaceae bacterium]|nr:tetratricopeptide repeat protein [Chitinophagaceae bacterium]